MARCLRTVLVPPIAGRLRSFQRFSFRNFSFFTDLSQRFSFQLSPLRGSCHPFPMKHSLTRRQFLARSSVAGAAALAFPTIAPSTVFGENAPSNRISIGLIGMGLMMGSHHNIML